jgi:hypothetical protein
VASAESILVACSEAHRGTDRHAPAGNQGSCTASSSSDSAGSPASAPPAAADKYREQGSQNTSTPARRAKVAKSESKVRPRPGMGRHAAAGS